MNVSSSLPRATKSPLIEATQFVRRSKSLASMLPSLLMTGVSTLLVTAILRLLWVGAGNGFVANWMENWLTAWPIAFPVAYLVGPSVARLAARISAPSADVTSRPAGLALSEIEAASARATAKNHLKVRRKRINTFEVA